MKLHRILSILILLTSIASISVRLALSTAPPANHTLLEVQRADGQWVGAHIIHSLTTVTFHWKTDVPNTNYGQWQLLDYPPGPNDLMAKPFAVSGQLPASPANQFKTFTIDFAQMHQQHPDKVPAVPPSAPKDYYVRLVPWTNSKTVAGDMSLNVKITLVSSISTGPGQGPGIVTGFKIDQAIVAPESPPPILAGIAVAQVRTSKPSSLAFRISQSAPVLDAQQHPTFPSGAVVFSEHVSSFNTRHLVGIFDLTNDTHYYYIIEVWDSVGNRAFSQGEFDAHSRLLGP